MGAGRFASSPVVQRPRSNKSLDLECTPTSTVTRVHSTEISLVAEPTPTGSAIAEVAALTGVSPDTLRYYERAGLLRVARDENGHRVFDEAAIARVGFISCLRRSQMPIRDIRRYVDLARGGPATESDRLALLESHRSTVRQQLADLNEALAVIEAKISLYGGTLTI